jgi:Zn-finger domain-containing protein
MAKNTLQDLRDHLFAQLEALNDKEKPLELDRAKVVCQTASQIIDSARVEVKYMEVTGQGEERAKKFFGPDLPVTVTNRLGNGSRQ